MAENEPRQSLGRALGELLGPAAGELGQLLADQVRFARWRAALAIVERAKKVSEEKELPRKAVPIRFLVPFLEKASLQDVDSDLAEMWSALLAKAQGQYEERYIGYIDILNKLSSSEAHILNTMWASAGRDIFSAWSMGAPMEHLVGHQLDHSPILGSSFSFDREVSANDFATDGSIVYFFHEDDVPNMNELNFRDMHDFIDLSHLQSQGLIAVLWASVRTPMHRHFVAIARLSPLGYDFVDACQANDDE
jgi:Abortive infection alpha